MKAALLLIDIQEDFLHWPGLQPAAGALTARAAALLEGCRRRRIPVIHLWTSHRREEKRRMTHLKQSDRWFCVPGTAGHQPPARLRPQDGESIVEKSGFNGFTDTGLARLLGELGCDTVILAGVHLHACVRAAATECLERSLQVLVADDAVASNDPIHAACVRRWLADRCTAFEPVAAILTRLDGGSARKWVHHSPRETATALFEVPISGPAEIGRATAEAREAWIQWRRTDGSFRRQLLAGLAERLEAAAAELARQMAIEIGKPLAHGLEEVRRAAANVRDVARRAAAFQPQSREEGGWVRHEPLGVVALISPWNNPVAIPIGKIAPALVYGNTVAWKPAPAATRIAETLMRLLAQAGVPAGAARCLTGDHTTAQRLAADQNVDAVTFTGSTAAGWAIQEICARRSAPLQAELGGNNAAIVWDDADPARAAAQIAWGAFGFAGQRCTANRRVIIQASRFESCLAELKRAAEELVWGDPLAKDTEIGPVINADKQEEHARILAGALADGASRVELIHTRLAREPWAKAGAYAQPAVVCCDKQDSPLVQEETMSPLLVVQPTEDFEHALELGNGVRQGLAAALFSDRPQLRQKFLSEAKAGILRFNLSTAGADITLPFGGWKGSGIGPPEHGPADPLFYTRMQAVYGAAQLP